MTPILAQFRGESGQLMLLVIVGAVYFVPTIIAGSRKHRNSAGIFFLNLFLGWTLIGWVGALIWSVWKKRD
jgi:hypothetical protein